MTRLVPALLHASLAAGLLMSLAEWVPRFEANARVTTSSPGLQTASTASVILEVTATDFQIGPEQGYLYLRVSSDHSAEAQILKRKTLFDKAVLVDSKRRLTQDEFTEIQHLTDEPEILKLDALYGQRIGDVLDVFTSWRIKIRHPERLQELVVIAFAPEEARRRQRPYPGPLVKLGCTIEKVRNETIGESADFDDECRRASGCHARHRSDFGGGSEPKSLACRGPVGWRRNRIGSGGRRNRGAAGCARGFGISG
jgi:hypothetical protein